jgi:hypothetical protein
VLARLETINRDNTTVLSEFVAFVPCRDLYNVYVTSVIPHSKKLQILVLLLKRWGEANRLHPDASERFAVSDGVLTRSDLLRKLGEEFLPRIINDLRAANQPGEAMEMEALRAEFCAARRF